MFCSQLETALQRIGCRGPWYSSRRFINHATIKGISRGLRESQQHDSKLNEKRSDRGPFKIPFTNAASRFVFGTRAVIGVIKAARCKIYNIYVDGGASSSNTVRQAAEGRGLQVKQVDKLFLDKLVKSYHTIHDGVAMECSEIPQIPVEYLKELENRTGFRSPAYNGFQPGLQSKEELEVNGYRNRIDRQNGMPLLLWLHGVTSDHNVAAICRTAFYFSVNSVIFSSRETSASPNSFTSRAGVGAAEFLQLFKVENPVDFMEKSQREGWKFIAACAPSKDTTPIESLDQRKMERKLVLMLGGEDDGLPKHLLQKANERVSIGSRQDRRLHKHSGIDSLNVGVAAGILCERLRTYHEKNY